MVDIRPESSVIYATHLHNPYPHISHSHTVTLPSTQHLLEKEHCEENILFWRDAEEFKQKAPQMKNVSGCSHTHTHMHTHSHQLQTTYQGASPFTNALAYKKWDTFLANEMEEIKRQSGPGDLYEGAYDLLSSAYQTSGAGSPNDGVVDGIAVDKDGFVFVSDTSRNRIIVF